MGLPLSPVFPASPIKSKIVWPSQPPQVPLPALSTAAGGTLPLTVYLVKTTWIVQTQDGVNHESTPSAEVAISVPANNVLVVASPPASLMPFALTGYNVYVGTSSGAEKLQNATPIAIGTNWQEPTTGLIAGVSPPNTWGTTLIFNFPGKEFPYSNRDWKGHDDFSAAGFQQSITWYVDQITDFRLPYIQDGNDVAAWDQFLAVAILRVPWDFYQDSTQAQFVTVVMTDTNPKIAYYQPGLWTASIRARRAILS